MLDNNEKAVTQVEKTVYEEEFLKRVEKAAKKGAKSGNRGRGIISILLTAAIVLGGFFYFTNVIGNAFNIKNIFARDKAVEDHDLTQVNYGLFGYKAGDFADVVLEKEEQLKKVEVYTAELSELYTQTQAGLFKLKVFNKCKLMTYHGSTIYTVDMSQLKRTDIEVDDDTNTVILYIPKPKHGKINIDKIEFGDTEKGVLAIGDIKLEAEQYNEIEQNVKEKMEDKLVEIEAQKTANDFAVKTIWEMYKPLISKVSPAYNFEVRIREN